MLLLDLDDFKLVNDTLGHAAGDRVLRAVASAWASVARETDSVGRVGGDEFAVLLEQTDEATAGGVAARLRAALPTGQGCSIGIAAWDGREDADALLARADMRMYDNKRERKREVVVVHVDHSHA